MKFVLGSFQRKMNEVVDGEERREIGQKILIYKELKLLCEGKI